MRVQAIQTGWVQVHERQRAGSGHGLRRALNTLLDPHWTPPLPILAWVVEHPEGILVVDTGETAQVRAPGYLPRWHPYFRRAVRFDVDREWEIDARLRSLGIAPADVRWVVLTHLHTDHAGGLPHFPSSTIYVSETELEAARGFMGRLRGYLPNRWPSWFAPESIPWSRSALEPFAQSFQLTRAGDVHVVPTPGHSAGHVSVLLRLPDDVWLCLAGDLSYNEWLFQRQIVDGVAPLGAGETAARESLARMATFCRAHRVVYLPSHDDGAPHRLANLSTVAL